MISVDENLHFVPCRSEKKVTGHVYSVHVDPDASSYLHVNEGQCNRDPLACLDNSVNAASEQADR